MKKQFIRVTKQSGEVLELERDKVNMSMLHLLEFMGGITWEAVEKEVEDAEG